MQQSNSITFHVTMRGEDHTVFTRECEAESPDGALEWAEELWPEATVLEVFEPRKRAEEVYDRARHRMDLEDEGIFDDDY